MSEVCPGNKLRHGGHYFRFRGGYWFCDFCPAKFSNKK